MIWRNYYNFWPRVVKYIVAQEVIYENPKISLIKPESKSWPDSKYDELLAAVKKYGRVWDMIAFSVGKKFMEVSGKIQRM